MNKYKISAKENQYRYFNLKADKPIFDVEPINRCITTTYIIPYSRRQRETSMSSLNESNLNLITL